MRSDESVTHWIEQLQDSEASIAQQELWNRYFHRLVALARQRMLGDPRRVEDEEDVALSALDSFFQGARRGRYPDLDDRTQLWPLLVKITGSKVLNQAKKHKAQKRGGGKVQGESGLQWNESSDGRRGIEQVVGGEPTPEFVVQVTEQCQALLDRLDDDWLRRVARLKLEGYTNGEIAKELDVVERTVERKLSLIRKRWNQQMED